MPPRKQKKGPQGTGSQEKGTESGTPTSGPPQRRRRRDTEDIIQPRAQPSTTQSHPSQPQPRHVQPAQTYAHTSYDPAFAAQAGFQPAAQSYQPQYPTAQYQTGYLQPGYNPNVPQTGQYPHVSAGLNPQAAPFTPKANPYLAASGTYPVQGYAGTSQGYGQSQYPTPSYPTPPYQGRPQPQNPYLIVTDPSSGAVETAGGYPAAQSNIASEGTGLYTELLRYHVRDLPAAAFTPLFEGQHVHRSSTETVAAGYDDRDTRYCDWCEEDVVAEEWQSHIQSESHKRNFDEAAARPGFGARPINPRQERRWCEVCHEYIKNTTGMWKKHLDGLNHLSRVNRPRPSLSTPSKPPQPNLPSQALVLPTSPSPSDKHVYCRICEEWKHQYHWDQHLSTKKHKNLTEAARARGIEARPSVPPIPQPQAPPRTVFCPFCNVVVTVQGLREHEGTEYHQHQQRQAETGRCETGCLYCFQEEIETREEGEGMEGVEEGEEEEEEEGEDDDDEMEE